MVHPSVPMMKGTPAHLWDTDVQSDHLRCQLMQWKRGRQNDFEDISTYGTKTGKNMTTLFIGILSLTIKVLL